VLIITCSALPCSSGGDRICSLTEHMLLFVEIRNGDGLGSVCCRTNTNGETGAGWRCCLRSDGCCDGATEIVDIPGYRPACCQQDTDTAARCCAQTYENVGLLPQCCDDDRLRPICCKRPDGSIRCCPANVGYCCGLVCILTV